MTVPSAPFIIQTASVLDDILKVQSRVLRQLFKTTKLISQRLKVIAKTATNLKKTAENAKKVTDSLRKGQFAKVNANMATAINFALSLASIGLSLLTINHIGNLQEIQLRKEGIIERDLNIAFQNFVKNGLNIRKLKEEFSKFQAKYDKYKGRLLTEVQQSFTNSVQARELSEKAKQQANDALYEARAGRSKVEAKIASINSGLKELVNSISGQNLELNHRVEEARRLGNDALYEVRAGRSSLEARVDAKFQAARNLANDALYEARAGRSKLEANVNSRVRQLELDFQKRINSQFNNLFKNSQSPNIQKQIDRLFSSSQNLINDALSRAKLAESKSKILQDKVNQNQIEITRLKQRDLGNSLEKIANNAVAKSPQIITLKNDVSTINYKLSGYGTINTVLKDGIGNLAYNLKLVDGRVFDLEKGVEIKGLNAVYQRIAGANSAITANKQELEKIKKQIEDGSLNSKQYNDLASKIALIPPLIARVPGDTVKRMPKPLSGPQIEAAASAGVCRSTRAGGCMSNALGNTANTINQNTNAWGRNLLNKFNAGANAAQLALLQKVDLKLGAQIAGGLSGAMKNIFQNKLVDRALSIANLATSTHNALMLSNNLTQTLFSATDNILNVVGIKIKDEKGADIGVKQVVDSLFLNFANTLFGAENVQLMNVNFKRANRIYQSTQNVLNNVTSMFNSTYGALEVVGDRVSKIGNAMRWFGVVSEKAFSWMNPNNKFSNPIIVRLTKLTEAADVVEQVSSEVNSAVEEGKELVKNSVELKKEIESLQKLEDKKEENERTSISRNEPDLIVDDIA